MFWQPNIETYWLDKVILGGKNSKFIDFGSFFPKKILCFLLTMLDFFLLPHYEKFVTQKMKKEKKKKKRLIVSAYT